MRLSVALFLARRGLRENVLSTALIVGAVAVGVGFQVPSGANLKGYRAELLAQSLDSSMGDVRVRPDRGPFIRDADAMATRLADIPGVIEVTPMVAAPAGIRGNEGRAFSVGLVGVEPRGRYHPYRLVAGHPLVDGDAGMLVGVSLARRLAVSVGDRVELDILLSTYPRLVLDDGGYGSYTLTVRGLVGFGASDAAFVTRSFLTGEIGRELIASVLVLHARDHEDAPALAAAVDRRERGVRAQAWMDDSAYLRSSVRAVETLGGASWVMGVLAVGIPVLALLYVSTLNRRRQIGLLTAMGFSTAELFVTFVLQALMLGLAGVTAGGVVAVALVRYLVAHPIFDYQAFVVRPILTAGALVGTAGLILATVVLAGSYPAWRAARLDPSRILRGIE